MGYLPYQLVQDFFHQPFYLLNGVLEDTPPSFTLSLFASRSYPQASVLKKKCSWKQHREKVTKMETNKKVEAPGVWYMLVLLAFCVWTVVSNWVVMARSHSRSPHLFLFDNMAKHLGLVEATEKTLSHIPPKLSQDVRLKTRAGLPLVRFLLDSLWVFPKKRGTWKWMVYSL